MAQSKDLDMVFVDQEKAFDRVARNNLWHIIEGSGVKYLCL